jgi:hypothetical protein
MSVPDGARGRRVTLRALGALAAGSAAVAAGCGGSGAPVGAEGAMKQWVVELSDQFQDQWSTLVPAQQALIPKARFQLCNEQTYIGSNVGNSPPSAVYLGTVSVQQESLPLPGHPTPPTPATLVTSKIEVGSIVRTITLTWFQLGGAWRWALSNAAMASYQGTTCPSVPSAGSPYLSTPTTAATTTTTAPLVPPGNIRVQALNGLQVGSLAGALDAKLKTDGYAVLNADNATARTTTTSIYVLTPGFAPEAVALAQKLGLPASVVVATTPPPPSAPIPNYVLGHADLVVVIGSDLAATLNG